MPDASSDYPRRVLVVDDCHANRALLAAILTHRNVPFDVAVDGREAVAKFEADDFDLVLMDIQMPIMDGFAATSAIRNQWPKRDVVIVAITASTGDIKGEVYRQAGFDSKIHKPFALRDIDSLLSNHAEAG